MFNKDRVLAVLVLFLFYFVQVGLTVLFPAFFIMPFIVLAAVVFYSLSFGARFGFVYGVVAGFLHEIFAVAPHGVELFIFSSVGALVGYFSSKFFRESVFSNLLFTAISIFYYFAAHMSFFYFQTGEWRL